MAFVLVKWLGLEKPWLQPAAIVRACVQLAALSAVLHFVIAQTWLVLTFLLVMVVAAASLVASRMGWGWRLGGIAGVIIGVCALVPGAIAVGSGAIGHQPNLLLALGGITVGNMMSISTLFGRSLQERLVAESEQVEGWLALGATYRQAARSAVRAAGSLALMPNTDQTRVTGMVTLPGAFVGAVFAGLPVTQAAVFQLVVLSAILAGGALALVMWSWVLGAPRTLPGEKSRELPHGPRGKMT